jgi:transaldolase
LFSGPHFAIFLFSDKLVKPVSQNSPRLQTYGEKIKHVWPSSVVVRNMLHMLPTLNSIGQSLWLENITSEQLQNGFLFQHIKESSIMGASIYPGPCALTLRNTRVYDNAIRKNLKEGFYGEQLALELLLEDARHAADLLRPVFDRTDGVDGWVELGVIPLSTTDTLSLVTAVANLYAKVKRPNILITIPSLPEWQEAIEEIIFREIPVNIVSLFSGAQFLVAAQTCLQGIQRRIFSGLKSVTPTYASISISRLMAALSQELPQEIFLQVGVAMARRIYTASCNLRQSRLWECVYNTGVRPLRLIWKIESGDDCQHLGSSLVQELIAPLTVAAIPENILQVTVDRYRSGTTMPKDGGDCETILSRYFQDEIDMNGLADKLQKDNTISFTNSWIELLDAVAYKSAALTKG